MWIVIPFRVTVPILNEYLQAALYINDQYLFANNQNVQIYAKLQIEIT